MQQGRAGSGEVNIEPGQLLPAPVVALR